MYFISAYIFYCTLTLTDYFMRRCGAITKW